MNSCHGLSQRQVQAECCGADELLLKLPWEALYLSFVQGQSKHAWLHKQVWSGREVAMCAKDGLRKPLTMELLGQNTALVS